MLHFLSHLITCVRECSHTNFVSLRSGTAGKMFAAKIIAKVHKNRCLKEMNFM